MSQQMKNNMLEISGNFCKNVDVSFRNVSHKFDEILQKKIYIYIILMNIYNLDVSADGKQDEKIFFLYV